MVCEQCFEVRSLYITKRLHHKSLSTKRLVATFSPLVYHFLSQLDTTTILFKA